MSEVAASASYGYGGVKMRGPRDRGCLQIAMAEKAKAALCSRAASPKEVRGRWCIHGIVVCGDKAVGAKLLVSSSVLVP